MKVLNDAAANRRAAAGGLALTAALCTGLGAPARADRHCFPSIELYFMARQVIQADDGKAAALTQALERLDAAIAEAGDCGCATLQAELKSVVAQARLAGVSVPAAAQLILGAEADVGNALEACHG